MNKLVNIFLMMLMVSILAACGGSETKSQGSVEPDNTPVYSVQLELQCVKNLIFNKYDIDVLVDGKKIGKLDHGATRTYSVELKEGTHTLVAVKEESSSVDGTIDFVASEGAAYKYKLSCTGQQVEIEEIVEKSDEIAPDESESNELDVVGENAITNDNLNTSLRTVSCFDLESNQEFVWGGVKFSFPAHFDCIKEETAENEVCYYPSEEICYCSLVFGIEDSNLSEVAFNVSKSVLAAIYLASLQTNKDMEISSIKSEEITVAGLSGWTMSFTALQSDNSQSMVNYTFILNPSNNKIITVLQTYGGNDQSNYDYIGDYTKILQSATLEDGQSGQANSSIETENSKTESSNRTLSYSTNDRETAKKGNTGVFSYQMFGKSYDQYWIIDFDEGYVYYFTEGNNNSICDRLEIESGDLNSVLIITYHDGGDEWSYGLHFKWKNLPDILVMQDNDGFEWEYSTTNLKEALKLRDSKTIKDY